MSRKAVLLPVGWETHSIPVMEGRPQEIINRQVLEGSDLLIAAFWTRLGTPTGDSISGTVEEIEGHVTANKPALLYFSSTPVSPYSVDPEQYRALKDFKVNCQERGLYETYESPDEFRNKLRRQLAITINSHGYFASLSQPKPESLHRELNVVSPSIPSISREAVQLLVEAIAGGGEVMVLAWLGGSSVQANGKNFVEPNSPRSRALWEGAVQELVQSGLMQPVGSKGQVFRVSRKGYETGDLWMASRA